MKILFTGASSFTGMWFAIELAHAGHEVITPLSRPFDAYTGLRKQRVEKVSACCRAVDACPFGSPQFLELIESEPQWDLFCHHAADVTDYKSGDFNVATALANNTHNVKQVLHLLKGRGCDRVVLTGSVFEQNEGAGSDNLRAVSPYGLSKGLTTEVFRYFATQEKMKLGKFVIPNPFGPYEEPRYTAFLMETWFRKGVVEVKTPAYVRDNIHVSLLAKAYHNFVDELEPEPGFKKVNPSGYIATQGRFTAQFAQEMEKRLGIPCQFSFADQDEFPEPIVRINTEPMERKKLDWKEDKAWDELAAYYKQLGEEESK